MIGLILYEILEGNGDGRSHIYGSINLNQSRNTAHEASKK